MVSFVRLGLVSAEGISSGQVVMDDLAERAAVYAGMPASTKVQCDCFFRSGRTLLSKTESTKHRLTDSPVHKCPIECDARRSPVTNVRRSRAEGTDSRHLASFMDKLFLVQ